MRSVINNEVISVVVPVYNVEPYLPDCLESICRQTYRNVEIILVDDGSTDGCGDICDKYKVKDSRVRVIHKLNEGLSEARNTGLRNATGELVLFVDADDYIEKNMVEALYNVLKNTNSDIAACPYRRFYTCDDLKSVNLSSEKKVYSGKEFLERVFLNKDKNIEFVAVNKLYKKNLFIENGIFYPYGKLYEDAFTTYKLIYFASKVVIIDTPLYNYRLRDASITRSSLSEKKCIDGIMADEDCVAFFWEKREKTLFYIAFNSFCRSQVLFYKQAKIEDNTECMRIIRDGYARVWRQYGIYNKMSFIKKIYYRLWIAMPEILGKMLK